jgi:hypothetical protein
MKLRKRQKRKTAQALDAAAGITKLWSEWQIGKRASKGAAKVKKSGVMSALSSTPVKLAGLAALVGGAGAAIAKKLKGGGPEASYTTSDGDKVSPPDVPPPLAIAPEPATATDATMPQGSREPAIGNAGLRPSAGDGETAEPAAGADPSAGGAVRLRDEAGDDAPGSEGTESAARPAPTAGGVDPAAPTDEPPVEPSTLAAQPEPIADERGGAEHGDDGEPQAGAAGRRPDGAAVD